MRKCISLCCLIALYSAPERLLPTAPIVLLCAWRHLYHHAPVGEQNGGSARDYLLDFAWSGATVMVQRTSGCPYGYSSAPSG